MRFLKEYFILLFIIIAIFGSDLFLSKMTENLVKEIDSKINEISEKNFDKNYTKEDMLKQINELENKWKDTEAKMSYFAEHNELEKVSGAISAMKSNINMDKRKEAYEKMEEIKFKLEYIKNKQRFEWNSLF